MDATFSSPEPTRPEQVGGDVGVEVSPTKDTGATEAVHVAGFGPGADLDLGLTVASDRRVVHVAGPVGSDPADVRELVPDKDVVRVERPGTLWAGHLEHEGPRTVLVEDDFVGTTDEATALGAAKELVLAAMHTAADQGATELRAAVDDENWLEVLAGAVGEHNLRFFDPDNVPLDNTVAEIRRFLHNAGVVRDALPPDHDMPPELERGVRVIVNLKPFLDPSHPRRLLREKLKSLHGQPLQIVQLSEIDEE